MEKKTSAHITHIRPLPGDSAELGEIKKAANRGGDDIHSRVVGGPVPLHRPRRREIRTREVMGPSLSRAYHLFDLYHTSFYTP